MRVVDFKVFLWEDIKLAGECRVFLHQIKKKIKIF